MIYKIRAILDVTEDVFRDVLIDENASLEDLHKTLTNSFDFNGLEMASFFNTDEDWNQGDEIPLINMSEDLSKSEMRDLTLKDTIGNVNDKLIYVYDFLSMWTFYVEVKDIRENSENIEVPKITLAFGNVPENAPEKEFKAEKTNIVEEDLEDEEFNDFNSDKFDSIDDLDLDKY